MADKLKSKKRPWRKWVRRGFVAWAIFVFASLFSGYRTVAVDPQLLTSDSQVTVTESAEALQFTPKTYHTGLIFFCGSGVSSHAYSPLLRPIAERGYGVYVIKLPYRFAPLESHKSQAVERALRVLDDHPTVTSWVFSGHSLGGAIACRIARDHPQKVAGLVLVGTTHPKRDDLSSVPFPVAKVYGSSDGIAPVEKINANKQLLPVATKYILIDGGNHAQFGNYAGQFLDGSATISRSEQQAETRRLILSTLAAASQ